MVVLLLPPAAWWVMAMKAYWTSRIGWFLGIAYLLLAGLLFYRAQTCTGWVCDLVALPAAVPFGFPIGWLTDWIDYWFQIPGHTPTAHFRNWYFILPTVVANTVFYYWLGFLVSWIWGRLSHKWSARE